jgi:hypothetical protein
MASEQVCDAVSNDMNASFMSLERHERGIHAL